MRLSRIWPSRSGELRTRNPRSPRRSTPSQCARRSASTVSTSTGSDRTAAASARASASRLSDQSAETLDLRERRPRLLRIHVLEPEPERRQRRAQLVRGVGDERLLRLEQPLELRRRLVELVREAAHLLGPLFGCAHIETTGADLDGRALRACAAVAPRRARSTARAARRRRGRRRRSPPGSASSA